MPRASHVYNAWRILAGSLETHGLTSLIEFGPSRTGHYFFPKHSNLHLGKVVFGGRRGNRRVSYKLLHLLYVAAPLFI